MHSVHLLNYQIDFQICFLRSYLILHKKGDPEGSPKIKKILLDYIDAKTSNVLTIGGYIIRELNVAPVVDMSDNMQAIIGEFAPPLSNPITFGVEANVLPNEIVALD